MRKTITLFAIMLFTFNIAFVQAQPIENFGNLPYVNLGHDTVLCSGSILSLDAQNAGSSIKYNWSTGDNSQTIIVTSSGSYSVTVTNNYGTAQDSINVTFIPSPVVDLGFDTTVNTGTTLILDAQNTGCYYQWSTGATSQTISVTVSGAYSVTVYCGPCSDRDTIQVSVKPTQVNFFSSVNSFSYYPNPINDLLNLKFKLEKQALFEVSIYNITGQELMKSDYNLSEGSNILYLNVKDFDAGIYFVRIKSNQVEITNFKFIK